MQVTVTAAILVVTCTSVSVLARFFARLFLVAARFLFATAFFLAATCASAFVLCIVTIRAVDVAMMSPATMMCRAAAVAFFATSVSVGSK